MKYDIMITFAGGVTRVIPFGMHKEWCEEIIAEDILPEYEGWCERIEIIPRA